MAMVEQPKSALQSVEQALEALLDGVGRLESERIACLDADDRVLADDVEVAIDVPPSASVQVSQGCLAASRGYALRMPVPGA